MTIKESIISDAKNLIQPELTEDELGLAYVTEKVAFNMPEVIRQCRKNYWGVFDSPIDPTTGREKIWEHLTKVFVDYVVQNIDLDTKDINFRAKHADAIRKASVVRSIVKCALDEIFFGEDLDIAIRQLAIDGTVVWANDDEVKPRLVNLLNFGIKTTAFSIADAYRVTERFLPSLSDFRKMAQEKDWVNWKDVQSRALNLNDPQAPAQATEKSVELFRRRGMGPKFLITGKRTDTQDIPLEIWFSRDGGIKIHEISKRKDNKNKGYEEFWYTRVFGRWYGEGVAERLIQKQIQENLNVNIRTNRALVSQLGVFLVRQGSGITPQMLSRLSANGALPVTNVETDIKQLPMQESSPTSYKDSEWSYIWSQRLTGANDAAIGEEMPASTPATNAVIQRNASEGRFTLIKEGIGQTLQRWLKNQSIPIIFSKVTEGQIVRMDLDPKDLKEYDEQEVNAQLVPQLEQANAMGIPVDPAQVMMEQQRGIKQLEAYGTSRYVTLDELIDILKYDVQVFITNEEFDKGVMTQNLITLLQAAPQYADQIISEIADLTGIGPFKQPQIMPGAMPPAPGMEANPTEQVAQANTFEGFGKAAA